MTDQKKYQRGCQVDCNRGVLYNEYLSKIFLLFKEAHFVRKEK